MGLFDKIYAKLGLLRDMFEISLSYLPQLNGKMRPFFIKIDDDVELLLDSQNDKICKNPFYATLIPKGVTVNDDIGENSDYEEDDGGDFCSHDGRCELYDTSH